MKFRYLFFCLLIFSQTRAQFGQQRIISSDARMARSVFAADINGDGHQDVIVSARVGDFHIAWFENLDGAGNFGEPHVIEDDFFDQIYIVVAADLDGDGDIDVLASARHTGEIVWYENLDGEGNFSAGKIIDIIPKTKSVIAADVDWDGNLDIIGVSDNHGLFWFKNLDGNGNFSEQKIIDGQIFSRSVVAVDFDGDGDLDILISGTGNYRISWYENLDGQGNFGPKQIIDGTGMSAYMVAAGDINGDGAMDIVFAASGDDEVAWFENLDGLGNFGSKNVISNNVGNATAVYIADLDNDGDLDVLATSIEVYGGEVVWFENLDGAGNFSEKKVISTEVMSPYSVIAADIDGDGDMDVVSASQNDNKVAWYRNQTLRVDDFQKDVFNVFPIPSNDKVFIDSKLYKIRQITVFDMLGQNVMQFEGNHLEIELSQLPVGMYFMHIKTDQETVVRKIIKN